MKQNLLQRTHALIALGMSAGMLIGLPSHSTERKRPVEEKPVNKSKAKSTYSRNNASVKIYPDLIKRNMHVIAKDNQGKEIDFYVFDLQGTLIQNFKMKEKDHQKIIGLARGKYIYRVFAGDLETASGEFEIR
ncbi:MAG TPA: T9SS type A sorting domain-containing protein [Chitinophagaceae bacterium]